MALALPLLVGWVGPCARAPQDRELEAPAPARSVRGVLRLSAYGSAPDGAAVAPLRHRTVYVNGREYQGLEDNGLRGYLDGRFKFGWNQATQVHVRAGRRDSVPKYGEQELFRALYRWGGIELPPGARVQGARFDIAVERGPERELQVLLYAVRKDWNPGEGGVRRDNNSPPSEGEVWWGALAHEREPWGLPGAGFASDTHARADTSAMPLAETRYAPGQERLVFESPELAAYVEDRVGEGRPLLFLLKLDDALEDEFRTLLMLHSGNRDDPWNPEQRPRLSLEWESPAEIASLERRVHLEHGREWAAPVLRAPGAAWVAASFDPDPGHEVPTISARIRPGADADAWRTFALPLPLVTDRFELRLLAARNPVVLGESFRSQIRDSWILTAPPEEQRVVWVFRSPSGESHLREARYAKDYRFEIAFEPDELGRWRYRYECDFAEPYRSPTGEFDVVAGDRENVRRQLRRLLERIRAANPRSEQEAVARFGRAFWRMERAALQRETPESFRSESGRELFALLTEVREALAQREVPERPEPKAMERDW
jgi:hypothetical protein